MLRPDDAFESFWGERWPIPECGSFGNGCFGRWIVDTEGRPAYQYEMDQVSDPRADYCTTTGKSRDHWHLVGNDRVIATAHNGGYVQLYDWSRGGKVINRWEPRRSHYAGGFKFITASGRAQGFRAAGEAFNTLWEHLPRGATQRRIFGMGYFEKVTEYRGLRITERIEAPEGDDPALFSKTVVENTGGFPQEVAVVEFWGVNLHQLTPGFVMTHRLGKVVDWRRSRLNRRFLMDACWDASTGTLRTDFRPVQEKRAPGADKPSRVDYHLKSVFLAALDPLPEGYRGYAADGNLFFGGEGIAHPPGAQGAADGKLFTGRRVHNHCSVLALRRTARLDPGQRVTWRYLYGYGGRQEIPEFVQRSKNRDAAAKTLPAVLEFVTPEAPWLTRELAWHSYYLQAGATYQDYFKTHFIDQGSAYGYLQGLSGAHRDFALFALPMVYLRPVLAREMLRFSMRSQDAQTGALPYMHMGHGVVSGAVIHGRSSDLDLFFLWALAEYLGATQDTEFLNEQVPFYPLSSGVSGTVLEHAQAAFRHLTQWVGFGRHGLLRCGTGDWNDALIAFSRRPLTTIRKGESALNAGLATVALPALAENVQASDPDFAARLRETASKQGAALAALWTGSWTARGYLGHRDSIIGHDRIFLDTQAFPVLGGLLDDAQVRELFETIQRDCVAPQPAGARAMWPPMKGPFLEPGSDTNGGTWAAIDSWIAWAWPKFDRRAWDFFLKTTLAWHAEAYPHLWYGVWSGPDSYNAQYHPRPGETFKVNFTPMTDFPVMNMNRHSGPLLDAVKLAGIGHRGGAIAIDPRLPFDSFAIRLPLIGVAYLPGRHRGYYIPIVAKRFKFAVRAPAGLDPQCLRLKVNGAPATHSVDSEGLVCFESDGEPGVRICWEAGDKAYA
jgi:hypothetical protein